jgi:DNA-binding beta-propeller fold protein YncE
MSKTELQYRVVQGWEQLPDGYRHDDVPGVSVDSFDRVFLLTRRDERVLVYELNGGLRGTWGEGFFSSRTHGLTVAPDDTIYCVDEGCHVVYHCTADGALLKTIGTPGIASDTGYDGTQSSITRSAPPFNRPTNLAIAPGGDLYVTDGYGNARVHRFTASGELLRSWGEPGAEPGQFRVPHGIAVTVDGEVLVADRENDRIQVFDPDGVFLREWLDVQRPTNIAIDVNGWIYVSEFAWLKGEHSLRWGTVANDRPGRVSVWDRDGKLLARISGIHGPEAASFSAPHDICVDSKGDIYVGEVTWSFAVSHGRIPTGPSLQKLTRVK